MKDVLAITVFALLVLSFVTISERGEEMNFEQKVSVYQIDKEIEKEVTSILKTGEKFRDITIRKATF